ncbi:MAG: cold-shock protein [Acidimicrobiia bacterium]
MPLATTRGRVVAFDDHRGIGEVEDLGTGGRVPFHCTAIADGTRTIRVGTDVVFRIVTGPLGIVEAAELRPA